MTPNDTGSTRHEPQPPDLSSQRSAAMYIELLKRALQGRLHPSYAFVDDEAQALAPAATRILRESEMHVVRAREARDRRVLGIETMLARPTLDNLHRSLESVLVEGVPGDLIETGVWRGGAAILMRGILSVYGVQDRVVYAADSFRGLPPPDEERYPADAGDRHYKRDYLSVSLDEVAANFRAYGLFDDQVRFLKGWFRDSLPTVAGNTWALIRLDGDMYESTMDGLTNLYPGLSVGGYLIVDDYGSVPACARAVDDFRRDHDITEKLRFEKPFAWWRRES